MDCEDDADAIATSQRLICEIQKPISLNSLNVTIGVSIGIASVGDEGCATETLIRNADLALYAAKRERRGTYRCYETAMESTLLQSKALENDLRLAMVRNEFSLHYQPIVHVVRNCVMGYEALLRWESPTRGCVSPADFIPFAEEHGLILDIGDWVLRTACEEAARWPDDLSISINLSPAQFSSPNLVKSITEILKTTGLSPTRLELEVTETSMIGDIATAKVILNELRALGIMTALDDFGTGCSSLSFLHMLPFTRIKIDKSFIQDLGKKPESLAIVRAVTGLCSSLGVAVTAEGVETAEQISMLQQENCHQLQGYLLGRPAPDPRPTPRDVDAKSTSLETAPIPSGVGEEGLDSDPLDLIEQDFVAAAVIKAGGARGLTSGHLLGPSSRPPFFKYVMMPVARKV